MAPNTLSETGTKFTGVKALHYAKVRLLILGLKMNYDPEWAALIMGLISKAITYHSEYNHNPLFKMGKISLTLIMIPTKP